MGEDAQTQANGNGNGKRKAEGASPPREPHDEAASIATGNDRKRLNVGSQCGPVTAASNPALSAHQDEIDQADDNPEDEDSNPDGEDDGLDLSKNSGNGEDEEGIVDTAYLRSLIPSRRYSDEEDDMGPPELEVEEEEHFIGGPDKTKFHFKTYLQEDTDEFKAWMQTIHVRCSYEGKQIGTGLNRYVSRDRIRSNFWEHMEMPCHELSQVAFDLFDQHGCLKEDLKSHAVRKGSGVWGSDLDLGSFFVIEHIYLAKEWRRKGLGKQLANFLLRKAQAGQREPTFTLVSPGWRARDMEEDIGGKPEKEQKEIRRQAINGATAFYRSLGFRRIGASHCFGLATDPDHPAHALASSADFDPVHEADTDDTFENAYEELCRAHPELGGV